MTAYVLFWLLLLVVVIAAFLWGHKIGPAAGSLPRVPDDLISEEVRRERLGLHHASRDYAVMQRTAILVDPPEAIPHVETMLAAAFRMGAKWQQRRDAR